MYTIVMKTKNVYPDWVEKYRGKGRTIRKVRNGYGLYECTSVYVKGSYPKSTQKFLGMIDEEKGFIPKLEISTSPNFIEFGLSHFIMSNFKRELQRASYDSNMLLVKLSIINFIFGSFDSPYIENSYVGYVDKEQLKNYASTASITRVKTITKRIEKLFISSIPDEKERLIVINLLKMTLIDTTLSTFKQPALKPIITDVLERNKLSYD